MMFGSQPTSDSFPVANHAGSRGFSVILEQHRAWLEGKPGGVRANLSRATMNELRLKGAQLSRADLSLTTWLDADVTGGDMSGASLQRVDFRQARLTSTDF